MIAPEDKTNMPTSTENEKPVALSYRLKIWRWFKLCSRILIYAPLLLLISLAVLIGTEFGSHITVKLADMLVPDLEVSYKSGQINRQLELNYGTWQMNGVAVEVSDLVLAWNPMCLMQKQLCVEQLSSSKVNVEIDTALIGTDNNDPSTQVDTTKIQEDASVTTSDVLSSVSTDDPLANVVTAEAIGPAETETTEENKEITLPFGITLNSSVLQQVTVRVNDMDFNANQLNLSAEWLSTGIRASSVYAEGLLVSIPLSNPTNTKTNTDNKIESAVTQETGSTTNKVDLAKDWAMANLPEVFMPIPVFVEALDIDNGDLILGPRKDHFSKLHLSGSYQQFLINIDDFSASHSYGDIRLLGQMSLLDDYPMDIHSTISLEKVKEIPGLNKQHLTVTVNQGFNELKSHIVGSGQFDFDLTSNIKLANSKIPYSLNLTAKKLQWPLENPDFIAENIRMVSQGDLAEQHVNLKGDFSSPYQPKLDIDTVFSHTNAQLVFEKLHAYNSVLGDLVIQGTFDYADQLKWNAKIAAQTFDISQLTLSEDNPLPASDISGPINSSGKYSLLDHTWSVNLNNADLYGHVMQYPLNVVGDLAINDKWHLSSDGLNVNALQSRLFIQGEVEKNWSLNGELTVPDLSLWQQDASGTINADINVSGENEHPDIEVALTATDLEFQTLELETMSVNGHYKPFDNQAFNAQMDLYNFKYQDLELNDVTLAAKGDLAAQSLKLGSTGELTLNSQIVSQYDQKLHRIEAQIKSLSLASKLGQVDLDAPLEGSYLIDKQSGTLQPFCLSHSGGKLCAKQDITLGLGGQAALEFVGDLGKLAEPWLPESIDWTGPAILTSNIQWFADSKPIGNVDLQLTEGNIDFKATNNSNVAVGYKSLQLRSRLDEKQLLTSLALESNKIATLDANLGINVTPDRQMDGKLALQEINLQALAVLLPELEVLEGIISSELTIGGSLSDPKVSGKIALNNGSIMATANPTLLEDIDLDFIFAGKKAQIDGELKMGKGQAFVDGQLDWAERKLKGSFDIKGKDLAVIQPPLAILNVGTDLKVKFTNESFDISGDINVPSGKITIVQLPEGGIAVSKDVVFEDSLASQETKVSPLAVSAQVNLNVGDDLRVDGMGLTGKLLGKLELKQDPFRPPLLFGEIKVVDGNYKFMGQTLEIRAGEMQFIGPIDVPNLNIEAVREIKDEDVIAGVRITGTPLKPVVNLFSNPTKEQAEILNYIVRGTGLSNNSVDQNSGLMMGAALTLSSQIGGGAIGNIGNTATGIIEKIGFSNVQLDANDDGRFAISGFIGEKLMVKYGVGVFNPGYEMTVRYYLLSQLYLETVSGTIEQSLDIYYSFDL